MKKTEVLKLKLDNKPVIIIINRKKIKNTYIRIDDNKQIVVNTNFSTSVDYLTGLVMSHKQKILRQIDNKIKQELPSDKIKYLGKIYNLELIYADEFNYSINNDKVTLYTNQNAVTSVEYFYRLKANEVFPSELRRAFSFFEKHYQLKYPTLEIRKMKRRFGTCYYTRNKICLNLLLIQYDIECINYVINHELCHFVYHDHSSNFYKLLGSIVNNHKELKNKLFNL